MSIPRHQSETSTPPLAKLQPGNSSTIKSKPARPTPSKAYDPAATKPRRDSPFIEAVAPHASHATQPNDAAPHHAPDTDPMTRHLAREERVLAQIRQMGRLGMEISSLVREIIDIEEREEELASKGVQRVEVCDQATQT